MAARPNLVKMAPVVAQRPERLPCAQHCIVHTAQHYDRAMSGLLLEQLGRPEPDHLLLGVGSATQAVQTAL